LARLGPLHRLSAPIVRTCRTLGVSIDGAGLRLRIMPNGGRSWIIRITVHGERRDISLGPLSRLSLVAARETAATIRAAIAEGRAVKAPSRAKPPDTVATSPTFADCWTAFWRTKEPQLSNGKHRDQWVATMGTYVLPQIDTRPIADIKPGEIIELLRPLWQAKEETARRVLQRVDAVFVSAITRELRDKANPCTGVARELGPRWRARPSRSNALCRGWRVLARPASEARSTGGPDGL
jgi:Arm DNA-binding domain